MAITVKAIYENGVLKLEEALPLKERELVRVTVEPLLTPGAATRNRAGDLARLMAHAGSVDLGKPTGANNESIDADLAHEYGSSHEDSH